MNGELFGRRSVQHCVRAAIDCSAIQSTSAQCDTTLLCCNKYWNQCTCAVKLRSAVQWLKLVAAWIILAARVFNAFQNNHSHDDDDDLRGM